MSDGPEGEGYSPRQDIIRVAPASWDPNRAPNFEGHRFIGRDPDSEKMDQLLRDVREKDLSRRDYLASLPKMLMDGSVLTDEKKPVYREVLEKATIGALNLEFKDDDKLMGLVEEIGEAKVKDPDESLFLQIQARLLDLVDRPGDFEVRGQKLTDDEVKKAIRGLKFARDDILVQTAKAAGIFRHEDPLVKGRERGINLQIKEAQDKFDYPEAIDVIDKLKSNPDDLYAVETYRLNRSSPDFEGISVEYISGAVNQMELYLSEAQAQHFDILASSAAAAGEPVDIVDHYRAQAAASRADAQKRNDRIKVANWGKARPQLKQEASDYLMSKGRYRQPDVARGGTIAAEGLSPLLDELREMKKIKQAEYELAIEQNKALTSGYDAFAKAIRQRAFTDPRQMDSSNPYWYRFERPGITDDEREKYQGTIRFFSQLNYVSYVKELTGAKSDESWRELEGVRLEREYFRQAWESMPGFQSAVLTIAKDIFEDSSFFRDKVGSDKEFDFQQFVLSEKGYKLLFDKRNIDAYRQRLTDALTDRLKDDPAAIKWARDHRLIDETEVARISDEIASGRLNPDEVREREARINALKVKGVRDLVQTSVYAADELFYSTGAYDSAHIYRSKIDELYQTDAVTQQIFDQKTELRIISRTKDRIEKDINLTYEELKTKHDDGVTMTPEEINALTRIELGEQTKRGIQQTIEAIHNAQPGYKGYTEELQEAHTISDGVRELFHPGLKLKERLSARKRYELAKNWIERNKDRIAQTQGLDEVAKEILSEVENGLAAERGFGGPLGEWIRENNSDPQRRTDRGNTFREEFRRGERDYIPERAFYSLLEMVDTGRDEYIDPQSGAPSTSIAHFLIDSRRTEQAIEVPVKENGKVVLNDDGTPKTETVVIYDFTDDSRKDSEKILKKISQGEWWGSYWDIGSAVNSLKEHQMGGDPRRSRLSIDAFLSNWIKVRGDKKLKPLFTDHAYLLGALGMAISPEKGFRRGRADHRLDIDDMTYQVVVNDILSDDRIYLGKGLPSRAELLQTFKTGDVHNIIDVLTDIFTSGNLLSSSYWEDRRSMLRRAQILRDLQQQMDADQARGAKVRFSFV